MGTQVFSNFKCHLISQQLSAIRAHLSSMVLALDVPSNDGDDDDSESWLVELINYNRTVHWLQSLHANT